MLQKVNVLEKLALFNDHWNPRIVGEVNDSHIKLTKLKGDFVWHHHENEDELFLVVKGELIIELKDQEPIVLKEGEFFIVPKGVEHRPVAKEEVHVILIEPKSTLNTGNVKDEQLTRANLEKL